MINTDSHPSPTAAHSLASDVDMSVAIILTLHTKSLLQARHVRVEFTRRRNYFNQTRVCK